MWVLAGAADVPADLAAFALLVVAETVVPPLAGPALPLAGLSAAEGDVGVAAAVGVATVASTVGALILYHLARAVGVDRVRQAVLRHEHWSKVGPEHFDRAEEWFNRHADAAVLLGRCVPVLRSLVSIPAGLERMPWLRFVLLTATGNLMWCSLVIGGAAALGDRVAVLQRLAAPLQLAVVMMWVVVLSGVVVRRRRQRRAGAEPSAPARRMDPPDPRPTDVTT